MFWSVFSMKLECADVDYGLEEAAFYEGPPPVPQAKGAAPVRKTVRFRPLPLEHQVFIYFYIKKKHNSEPNLSY